MAAPPLSPAGAVARPWLVALPLAAAALLAVAVLASRRRRRRLG
jgi:hypothetical protein